MDGRNYILFRMASFKGAIFAAIFHFINLPIKVIRYFMAIHEINVVHFFFFLKYS